jgi:recombination protein RecR
MPSSPLLENLIQHFNRLPGIGRKTATRLAWHLISGDKATAEDFASSLVAASAGYCTCLSCLMLCETNPCHICSDTDRADDLLCIVESTSEVYLIENMHDYQGKYFVLGHLLSPLEGVSPQDLHLSELLSLVKERSPREIILALKPSSEGEATIHYISEILSQSKVNLTRLSTGIPFGGDLEYTSSLTLANAFKRRYSV